MRDGSLPRASEALLADAVGTVAGAALGTSTVTAYIESGAGVAAGGRTGLTALVTAGLFLADALRLAARQDDRRRLRGRRGPTLYPVVASPLIIVGAMIIGTVRDIDWNDPTEGIPAFLTMVIMPLAVSITEGVAFGVVAYAVLKIVAGRARQVHPLLLRVRGAVRRSARYATSCACERAPSEPRDGARRRAAREWRGKPLGCYDVGFRRLTTSMDVQVYKDALLKKRSEILGAGGIKPLQASMENNTRQGDMADQASGNNEVHIQLKLKQTDAKILQAHRGSAVADRKRHLRRLPRLRRADRRSPAERDSLDARVHHVQGKAGFVNDLLQAPAGVLPREAGHPDAARGRRASRRAVRRQQHLPIHHQPRGHALLLAVDRHHVARRRSRDAARRPLRPAAEKGRDAWRAPAEGARARRAGVRRSLAAARRGDDQRAAPRHASRDPRRDARAEALLRAGAPPATSICSAAVPMPSDRASARCCPRGGSNSKLNRVIE